MFDFSNITSMYCNDIVPFALTLQISSPKMLILHDTLISMNAIMTFKVHPKINLTTVLVSLNCKYPKKNAIPKFGCIFICNK